MSEDSDVGVSSAVARKLWEDTDLLIGIGSRLKMHMRWLSMMKYYDRSPQDGEVLSHPMRLNSSELILIQKKWSRLKPDVGIVADSIDGVTALINRVNKIGFQKENLDRIASMKAKMRKAIEKIQPQMSYLDIIRDILPRDGYFFVEELCQAGFTSYYGFPVYEPRTYVSSGYQGTLGFGFPTALGVKASMPDKAVVSIIGDGGFMFAMPELSTAVQHNLSVITVLFNNNSFGTSEETK